MMAVALAAAIAAASPPQAGAPAVRQATATVRIVSGARIVATDAPETALVRTARIHQPDGSEKMVRLIEFP